MSTKNPNVIPLRPAFSDENYRVPIRLVGGELHCSRCQTSGRAATWSVWPSENEVVCADCAIRDPELWAWQNLCDIYDQIDELMQATPDASQRKLLGDLIAAEAPHFAEWRDHNGQGENQ